MIIIKKIYHKDFLIYYRNMLKRIMPRPTGATIAIDLNISYNTMYIMLPCKV